MGRHADAFLSKTLGDDGLAELAMNEAAGQAKTPTKAPRKLSAFIEGRKKKAGKSFVIEMGKTESADCPDCGKTIFSNGAFSGCICYGDDMARKVFVRKHERGVQVRFSKGWDPENVAMLLEALRRRNSR